MIFAVARKTSYDSHCTVAVDTQTATEHLAITWVTSGHPGINAHVYSMVVCTSLYLTCRQLLAYDWKFVHDRSGTLLKKTKESG